MVVDMTVPARIGTFTGLLLPFLNVLRYRGSQCQRMDHLAHRQKLQRGDDRRPDLHGAGVSDDDRREAW